MGVDMTATTIRIAGHDDEPVEAYLARPDQPARRGGVVVIHHMPGWDRGSKETTRRFAELGYDAICPNLYWREAPGASAGDAAALARSRGGAPDARVVGDLAGAARHLRALDTANGRIGVIGYCSGGRQAVLLGCRAKVDAVVDCFGAAVVGQMPANFPALADLVDDLPQLSAPLLGLFGDDDHHPSPQDVAELDQRLTELGKEHTFHSYAGAGHAFFATERVSYRVDAANQGWNEVELFFDRHLAG